MGRDSITFRDNGTEVSSLSRDKGTTGQAQNLATGRDGPGFFETVPSRPGTSRGTKLPSILHIYAVFREKFQKKIQKKKFQKKNFKKKIFLANFGHFLAILSRGTSRDRGFCPGTFAPALVPGQRDSGTGKTFLSRDKGTTGQGNFFVPGQRDNGTSRPGLSRDVPSLGNTS